MTARSLHQLSPVKQGGPWSRFGAMSNYSCPELGLENRGYSSLATVLLNFACWVDGHVK